MDARQVIQLTEYKLPLLLDGESRSEPRSRGDQEEIGGGALGFKMRQLIMEAVQHLEVACQLDPKYPVARINLACAHILLKDLDEAEYHLRKAKKLLDQNSEKNLVNSILVIEGIIAAEQEEMELATSKFQEAADSGNTIAEENLQIQNGTYQEPPWVVPGQTMEQNEFIENLELQDVIGEISIDRYVNLSKNISLNIKDMGSSLLYIHYDEQVEEYVFTQVTKSGYTGETSKGVRLKDRKEKVKSAYGTDGNVLQIVDAEFVSYAKDGIIFQFNNDGELRSWAVYIK